MKTIYYFILLIISPNFLIHCKKGYQDRFGPFYVLNDSIVYMNGDMGSRVDDQFEKLIESFPNIGKIVMEDCPGSRNDEEMFKAALKLHSLNINTHLPNYAKIQSGAVDFYLSGVVRTLDDGAKIGVHSWSDGTNSATDYPEGHNEHEIYLDFYESIGFSTQEAEDFYFFTINAASPSGIHWMTEQEIMDYNFVTP